MLTGKPAYGEGTVLEILHAVMYERPPVGVSSACDPLYAECKQAHVVGASHLLPTEWLDNAKSVISIFNPFTQQLKDSNAGGDMPSLEWLHRRVQGQD